MFAVDVHYLFNENMFQEHLAKKQDWVGLYFNPEMSYFSGVVVVSSKYLMIWFTLLLILSAIIDARSFSL